MFARSVRLPVRLTALLLACLVPAFAYAQDTAPRLDVPYVPTPESVVERMLEMAKVTKDDFVIDLGSGDGRIPVTAARKYGVRALGVDLNPVRVREANENAKAAGVTDKVEFREQNLFQTDISKASVLTMYLLSSVNLDLRPRILAELRPGTRVVSHAFSMGEWTPDEEATVDGRRVFKWIVPAAVQGRWTVQAGGRSMTLDLRQEFQVLSGAAEVDGRPVPVQDGRLSGDRITFSLDMGAEGRRTFTGRVSGSAIEGDGGWKAARS
jgi:precorrin-6B methylase 2